MWAELLFFAVVIGIAVQQLYSVSKAQKKTAEEERLKQSKDDSLKR